MMDNVEDTECMAAAEEARGAMLDDEEVMEVSDLFKVFGDSTRVRILWALNGRELCVRAISGALGLSMSAVSHQLKSLKDSDLVQGRRDGKQVYYSLCDEHVRILLDTALTHLREEK